MPSLLVQVKAKMALHAHEKVRGLLEGEYGSVFKGRSMDFDDLREYTPGDDVKDIDWKATARSGNTLIRRYVAVRKHNILLVVDTGRNMAATSADGDNKRDVAVMTAGVISYIALKHGDLVGLVAGDTQRTVYMPFKGTTPHVERLLQDIHTNTALTAAPGNIVTQLEYIAKNLRRRMMLVVISDDSDITPAHQQVLRRLRAQHEIIWLTIGDASGLDEVEYFDIDGVAALPHSIRSSAALQQAFAADEAARIHGKTKTLERLGIVSERITGDAAVVSGLFKALERQKYAARG
ncbi:MAG: DUF58 domain-containing protein [Candidatus Saccharibacteria bacterium]|nr:DUF58 domain-containing protein [Candidatus Saccharibacteria bacterium]